MAKLKSTELYRSYLFDTIGFHPDCNRIIDCLVNYCYPNNSSIFRNVFWDSLRVPYQFSDLRKFFLTKFLTAYTIRKVEPSMKSKLLLHIHNLNFDRQYRIRWYMEQTELAKQRNWCVKDDYSRIVDDEIQAMVNEQYSIITSTNSGIGNYRNACSFRLDGKTLHRIAGYEKLKKYGWYSPDNIQGMTKDHMLSVHDGFYNKIDPALISHPANCEFLSKVENSSKNYRSSISLDDLKHRIQKFEKY